MLSPVLPAPLSAQGVLMITNKSHNLQLLLTSHYVRHSPHCLTHAPSTLTYTLPRTHPASRPGRTPPFTHHLHSHMHSSPYSSGLRLGRRDVHQPPLPAFTHNTSTRHRTHPVCCLGRRDVHQPPLTTFTHTCTHHRTHPVGLRGRRPWLVPWAGLMYINLHSHIHSPPPPRSRAFPGAPKCS
jgi:hypothetical protein